jgi:hypothetical protein
MKATKFIFLTLLLTAFLSNVDAQSSRKGGKTSVKPNTSGPGVTDSVPAAASTSKSASSTKDINEKPLRKEIEAKSGSDKYTLLPAGKRGVVAIYKSDDRSVKGRKFEDWVWTYYNNSFEEIYSKTISVSDELVYVDNYLDEENGHLYALFAKAENIPDYPWADGCIGAFEVHDMDLVAKNINIVTGIFTKKIRVGV